MERGAHTGGLLAGLVTSWRAHTGEDGEELQPPRRTHIGEVCGNSLPWERPHTGAGEEREQEGAAEATCDGLTASPIPRSFVLLRGQEVEKTGSKDEPRKKGWVEGRCFKIWFYFPLTYSDLTGDKLSKFPQAESVLTTNGNWRVISPHPSLDPQAFCRTFSPLSS